MIKDLREKFNLNFSDEKYKNFVNDLNHYAGDTIPFRIAETPVFVPLLLKAKLITACNEIIKVIKDPAFKSLTQRAIPDDYNVPGEDEHPMWLAFDFAICLDKRGEAEPQLIEMQGFPSLFYYQHILAGMYRKNFHIDDSVSHLNKTNGSDYIDHIRALLLNGHPEENVILLEVEPLKQNTRVDFVATEKLAGIRAVCISELILEQRKLYYLRDGIKTPVHRIYNRVIFDELSKRTDLKRSFNLTEEVDVEWAGHPNWFFRVSKFTMPFLKNSFVPETTFLHELKNIPHDLENYVLKPLFSFSGTGVIFHVTEPDIANVKDPENWILQKKVNYEPIIKSPDGNIKTEIRMLYSWAEEDSDPRFIINMARLSKGEMIGVKFNKNKTWVGGSVAFFENDNTL